MKWQYLAIQFVLTFLAVIVAVRLLVPATDMSQRIDGLDKKLNNIAIKDAKGDGNKSDLFYLKKSLKSIDSRLAKMEEKLTKDKRKIGPEANAVEDSPVPSRKMHGIYSGSVDNQAASGWMSELSIDQKDQVDLIFREHAERLRELVPMTPEGKIYFSSDTTEAFHQQREELEEKMSLVLDENQYEKFIESLPSR